MDGTLLNCETLEVLAKEAGVEREVRKITNMAMNGEIDFEEAVKKRLRLLKGTNIGQIAQNLPLMRGAKELVLELKKRNFKTAIITGGFDIVAEETAKRLNMDFFIANKLYADRGKITGNYKLLVKGNKGLLMNNLQRRLKINFTLAVGDGANDIPMLKAAQIGIAFCAKKRVNEEVELRINEKNLMRVLDYLY